MTETPAITNTCAVIVTHNPDGAVFRLLNAIENQVARVIVVDNASAGEFLSEIACYSQQRNMTVIKNSSNEGIAAALNLGMKTALCSGYRWAISFDQDTIPFNNILELLCNVFNSCPARDKIGAIGANFGTGERRSYHRVKGSAEFAVRDYLITSGCLLNLEAYSDAGDFRSDFFIDNVDLEYSLRLRKRGWLNIISREWGMVHKAGKPVSKSILGFRVNSSGHNTSRRYFMARNHVLLTRGYIKSFPMFIAKLNFFFLVSVVSFMIAEKERRAKLNSVFRGIMDGFRYKNGMK